MTDGYEQINPNPPLAGDETAILLGFLERQRATVGSSSMTLGGMLKHMARFEDDMSTEWLHGRDQISPWNTVDWETDHDWDWRSAAADSPEQLYSLWQNAVARSRALFAEALADGSLDRQEAGSTNARGELRSLPYILINMIEEYARHNGHADLLRESVDGLIGHDPPG